MAVNLIFEIQFAIIDELYLFFDDNTYNPLLWPEA